MYNTCCLLYDDIERIMEQRLVQQKSWNIDRAEIK